VAQDENPATLGEEFGTPVQIASTHDSEMAVGFLSDQGQTDEANVAPIDAAPSQDELSALREPPSPAAQPLPEGQIMVTVIEAAAPSASIYASKRIK
jgi:hypothetical protein